MAAVRLRRVVLGPGSTLLSQMTTLGFYMETKCFVEITILALWKEQGMHHICIYAKGYAVDSNKNVLFIFSKYL